MAAETPGSPEDYSLFLSENGHLSFENPNYQVITGYWLDRLWRWYWYTRSNIDFENSAFPHWFFWGSYFIIIWTDWWLYLPFLQFLRRILPCSQQLLRSRFLPCNFFHITFLPLSSDFLPQSISWSNHIISEEVPLPNNVCKRVTFLFAVGTSGVSIIWYWWAVCHFPNWPLKMANQHSRDKFQLTIQLRDIYPSHPAQAAKSAANKDYSHFSS